MKTGDELERALARALAGGEPRAHAKAREQGKLFCRERLALLLDPGSFVEDGALANCEAEGLPADGIVTGTGLVEGRPVCAMANDSTVKAGSWGRRTVEKILRIQERAERLRVPLVYLVENAWRLYGPAPDLERVHRELEHGAPGRRRRHHSQRHRPRELP